MRQRILTKIEENLQALFYKSGVANKRIAKKILLVRETNLAKTFAIQMKQIKILKFMSNSQLFELIQHNSATVLASKRLNEIPARKQATARCENLSVEI